MDTTALQNAIDALDPKVIGSTEYRRQVAELQKQWTTWLREQYLPGIDPAKAQKVFDMAWEDAHASGYQDVEYRYQDLATLVLALRD